ncbi:MAG: hypothetical protein RIT45_3963 [Pseudomonadota bacterium]
MPMFVRLVASLCLLGLAACSKGPGGAASSESAAAAPAAPAPAKEPAEAAAADPSVAAPAAADSAAEQGEAASPEPPAGAADAAATTAVTHDARLVRGIVEAYDTLRTQLADGDFEAAKLAAIDVGVRAAGGRGTIYVEMADAARKVTEQRSIAESRKAFAVLSQRLRGVVADTPVVAGQVHAFRCAQGAGAGVWLQLGSTPRNPYQQHGGGPVCAQPIAVHP